MGRPKALLSVPPNDRPLIAHIIQRLSPLSPRRIIVVANDCEIARQARLADNVEVLADLYPDAGSLGGIATALGSCDGWMMLVACDMPLVNPDLFRMLWKLVEEGDDDCWDVVIPHVDGYAQTHHALYHPRCLPIIEPRLAAGQLKVADILVGVRVLMVEEDDIRSVDPHFRSFFSANTPEEWCQALQMLSIEQTSF